MVALRIALRYLFSKKSHSAVNIISLVSMAGVCVATIAIVCVLSVFNGFSDLANERLSVIDPDIKIVPVYGKTIRNAETLASKLRQINGIDTAVATVSDQALAIVGQRQMAVNMKGVPEGYTKISSINKTVIDGEYPDMVDSSRRALLSVGTAIKLSAHPEFARPFAIYVPRREGRINPSNPMAAFRSDSLEVTGVYEVQDADKDASTVVVPIGVARRLLDYTEGEASAIEVSLKPGVAAKNTVQQLKEELGNGFNVMDRLQQEEKSFRMISIEKWITFIMLAFILLIASFNVISTLSMLMLEKADNMATLRAMGARQRMIRSIFVWEGWLISTIGGLTGIATGVVLCLLQKQFGFIKLSGDESQLSILSYPVRVAGTDLLIVMGLVIVTGLFIALVTSRFAPRR